jgi:hypothetical protein
MIFGVGVWWLAETEVSSAKTEVGQSKISINQLKLQGAGDISCYRGVSRLQNGTSFITGHKPSYPCSYEGPLMSEGYVLQHRTLSDLPHLHRNSTKMLVPRPKLRQSAPPFINDKEEMSGVV